MFKKFVAPAMLVLLAGSAAQGQVIISEIFANTLGGDVPGEWAEIYNAGSEPVDISGWALADEDLNSPSDPFPVGFIIQPGEAVVIIGSNQLATNPDAPRIVEADFFASWGSVNAGGQSYRIILQEDAITLANTPSGSNEVLTLVDQNGVTVDVANYENGTNGWPPTPNGASITLASEFLNDVANDFGCAWRTSILGVDGAVQSVEVIVVPPSGTPQVGLSGLNVASPGYVAPQSGAPADCNNNGIPDALDICSGNSLDCNGNGVPDECEPDCDANGIPDQCEIAGNFLLDTNLNGALDSCEIALDPSLDLNGNGQLDGFDAIVGDAIVTEIMFDPFTAAEEMEYVEILNTTGAPLDISGWQLRDIEPNGENTDRVPAGTILAPGAIAVLTRSVTGDIEETRQTYIDAWGATTPDGTPILWIPLENWGARATNGTSAAEVLTLVSGDDFIVDIANYVNKTSNNEPLPGGWPGGDGHSSYFLTGDNLNDTANDIGTNWRLSIDGLSGARRSNSFSIANPPSWTSSGGEDFGSPGFIFPGAPQQPSGTVIITEIMYTSNALFPGSDPLDPNAPAGADEWVEIYNTTNSAIDISGWYLQDEDGRTTGIAAGSILQPGEVAVIVGNDFQNVITDPIAAFYEAWGCGYQVFAVSEWYTSTNEFGLARLANAPNFVNEILRLVDANGTPTDVVNYDDDSFVWPVDSSGVVTDDAWSIYILPNNYSGAANDSGQVWADALAPIDGARIATPTFVYNGIGDAFGSPGHLEGVQIPDLGNCPAPACTGDIADDFGTIGADGQVSFGDFLALLGLIGPCPGGAPTCIGDIADDFGTIGADGQVSFGDFLALLGLIGPCP
jgi:hypothetical protein